MDCFALGTISLETAWYCFALGTVSLDHILTIGSPVHPQKSHKILKTLRIFILFLYFIGNYVVWKNYTQKVPKAFINFTSTHFSLIVKSCFAIGTLTLIFAGSSIHWFRVPVIFGARVEGNLWHFYLRAHLWVHVWLTYRLTYELSYRLTYGLTYWPTYGPTCVLTCRLIYRFACGLTYGLTCGLTYMVTYALGFS